VAIAAYISRQPPNGKTFRHKTMMNGCFLSFSFPFPCYLAHLLADPLFVLDLNGLACPIREHADNMLVAIYVLFKLFGSDCFDKETLRKRRLI
jgi:hypothetical protein